MITDKVKQRREQILTLASEGLRVKAIAVQLDVPENTIRSDIQRMLKDMGAENLTHAVGMVKK